MISIGNHLSQVSVSVYIALRIFFDFVWMLHLLYIFYFIFYTCTFVTCQKTSQSINQCLICDLVPNVTYFCNGQVGI